MHEFHRDIARSMLQTRKKTRKSKETPQVLCFFCACIHSMLVAPYPVFNKKGVKEKEKKKRHVRKIGIMARMEDESEEGPWAKRSSAEKRSHPSQKDLK